MTDKKKLDGKYSYSRDDNGVLHLYRDVEKCDSLISNPLISAIYNIEQLEEDNKELKLKLEALEGQTPWKDIKDKSELIGKLTKATELLRFWVNNFYDSFNNLNRYEERHKALKQSEQFLKELE